MTASQTLFGEVAAFFDLFLKSDWASCHVRGGAIEMFVARQPDHANPLLDAIEDEIVVVAADETMLTASHLGTLVDLAAIGSRIEVGGRYATIELLGEPIDLVADRAGMIARHFGRPGALVQYEEALVALH